ncbi:MAG: DUF5519 family protein [Bacteroidia bacterium]|jgi:hypothetical protein|nr:DUF5519 family protein [Bacteroidia bacterium]
MEFSFQIQENVLNWPGTSVAPHRFGGIEFQFNGKEFGHIHSNGMLDILFTKKIREQLVAENLTQIHHLLPQTGWTSFYSRNQPEYFEQALKLLRLNYLLHYYKHTKEPIDWNQFVAYPKSIQDIVSP